MAIQWSGLELALSCTGAVLLSPIGASLISNEAPISGKDLSVAERVLSALERGERRVSERTEDKRDWVRPKRQSLEPVSNYPPLAHINQQLDSLDYESENAFYNQQAHLPARRYNQHKNKRPVYAPINQQTVNGILSLLLLFIVSICGCIGTIFIISALTVIESLQTRGNCYLVSLALAHLLVTLIVIPSSALQIMAGEGINERLLCHYQWLTLDFSLIVSQLSFLLIAADNFLGYKSSEKVTTSAALAQQAMQQTTIPPHIQTPLQIGAANQELSCSTWPHNSAAASKQAGEEQQQSLLMSKQQPTNEAKSNGRLASLISGLGIAALLSAGSSASGAQERDAQVLIDSDKPRLKLRLAHHFATGDQAKLESGGCLSYRNCCGRLKVLLWILLVWSVALAYTLHQHEFSYGPNFCALTAKAKPVSLINATAAQRAKLQNQFSFASRGRAAAMRPTSGDRIARSANGESKESAGVAQSGAAQSRMDSAGIERGEPTGKSDNPLERTATESGASGWYAAAAAVEAEGEVEADGNRNKRALNGELSSLLAGSSIEGRGEESASSSLSLSSSVNLNLDSSKLESKSKSASRASNGAPGKSYAAKETLHYDLVASELETKFASLVVAAAQVGADKLKPARYLTNGREFGAKLLAFDLRSRDQTESGSENKTLLARELSESNISKADRSSSSEGNVVVVVGGGGQRDEGSVYNEKRAHYEIARGTKGDSCHRNRRFNGKADGRLMEEVEEDLGKKAANDNCSDDDNKLRSFKLNSASDKATFSAWPPIQTEPRTNKQNTQSSGHHLNSELKGFAVGDERRKKLPLGQVESVGQVSGLTVASSNHNDAAEGDQFELQLAPERDRNADFNGHFMNNNDNNQAPDSEMQIKLYSASLQQRAHSNAKRNAILRDKRSAGGAASELPINKVSPAATNNVNTNGDRQEQQLQLQPEPVTSAANQLMINNSSSARKNNDNQQPRPKFYWLMLFGTIVIPSLASIILFARAYLMMKEFKTRPYKPIPVSSINLTLPALLMPNPPAAQMSSRAQICAVQNQAKSLEGEKARQVTLKPSELELASNQLGSAQMDREDADCALGHQQESALEWPPARQSGPVSEALATSRRSASQPSSAANIALGPKEPGKQLVRAQKQDFQLPRTTFSSPSPLSIQHQQSPAHRHQQVNQVMSAPIGYDLYPHQRNLYPIKYGHQPDYSATHRELGSRDQSSCSASQIQQAANQYSDSFSAPPSASLRPEYYLPDFEQMGVAPLPAHMRPAEHEYEFRRRQHHAQSFHYGSSRTRRHMPTPLHLIPPELDASAPENLSYSPQHLSPEQQQQQHLLERHRSLPRSSRLYQSEAGRPHLGQLAANQAPPYERTHQERSRRMRGQDEMSMMKESEQKCDHEDDHHDSANNERQLASGLEQKPDIANKSISAALANVIKSMDDQSPSAVSITPNWQHHQSPMTETRPDSEQLPNNNKPGNPAGDNNNSNNNNNKAILCTYSYMTDDQLLKSNIVVFILNLTLWLPLILLSLVSQYRDHLTQEVKDGVWWMATLNCCSCSYVYALTNKDFREAFNKLFYYCCCKSHVTFQRKTPIFRRQLDIDSEGNLRIHIIPGLNLYSNKLTNGADPHMTPTQTSANPSRHNHHHYHHHTGPNASSHNHHHHHAQNLYHHSASAYEPASSHTLDRHPMGGGFGCPLFASTSKTFASPVDHHIRAQRFHSSGTEL